MYIYICGYTGKKFAAPFLVSASPRDPPTDSEPASSMLRALFSWCSLKAFLIGFLVGCLLALQYSILSRHYRYEAENSRVLQDLVE
jgi:hypothetical protein